MTNSIYLRMRDATYKNILKIMLSQRGRLFEKFLQCFQITSSTSCIDIGGFSEGFETLGEKCLSLAINPEIRYGEKGSCFIIGKGQFLPFKDNSVDIVIMNSLLEHVEDPQAIVNEAKRVCRSGYFIQVPYLYFPLEPHYLLPFFQYVPESIKRFLVLKLGMTIGWISRGNYDKIRLFTGTRLRKLCPDAQIQYFRVMGIPIDLIAFVKK